MVPSTKEEILAMTVMMVMTTMKVIKVIQVMKAMMTMVVMTVLTGDDDADGLKGDCDDEGYESGDWNAFDSGQVDDGKGCNDNGI